MKLGILVNTNKHREHILGLAKAARAKGHEITIFNMDEGTKLLGDTTFRSLCGMDGVSMSFCDHSAKKTEISSEGIPPEIVCGSQYNNAVMIHETDKIVIL
ncbi:MAG TPA: hypothetical protein DCP92_00570 [Nitrospiraceae bacterium]|jgi:predicted peroxiredoxin|nr:hypothetical protein [Nitrospiraceae bacterium]